MGDVYVWDGSQLVPAVAAENRTAPGGDAPSGGLVGIYNGQGSSDDLNIADSAGVHYNLGTSYYNTGQGAQLLGSWDEDRISRSTMPVIDMETKNYQGGGLNSFMDWAGIAAGQYDADIAVWADRLAAYDTEIWFAFDQEPDVRMPQGKVPSDWTADEYVSAYRHIVAIMRPAAPKLKFCFWVGGSSSQRSLINALYPGDDVVDLIGWDPYVSAFESSAQTPMQCWGDFKSWLDGRTWGYNKPRGLFETGFDARHGKEAGIAFWEATPAAFRDLGLGWVTLFNRNSGPNTEARIDDLAVMGAYGAAMRAIQAGEV